MGILGETIQATVLPGNKFQSNEIVDKRIKQRLAQLGDCGFDDMKIRPFAVERLGMQSGFIPLEPEEEDEDWCVEFHPEISTFCPPCDGEYDTSPGDIRGISFRI